jgi:hypothetical protein
MLPCSRVVLSQDCLISGAVGVEPRIVSEEEGEMEEGTHQWSVCSSRACGAHAAGKVGLFWWGKSDCKTT